MVGKKLAIFDFGAVDDDKLRGVVLLVEPLEHVRNFVGGGDDVRVWVNLVLVATAIEHLRGARGAADERHLESPSESGDEGGRCRRCEKAPLRDR